MYGKAALEGWRAVVDAVHAAGGVILPQLWHQGVMREMGTGPHPEVESVRPSGIWGPLDRTAMVSPHYMETRSEEHTYELQSLMRISYAVFCLKQKKQKTN